MAGRFAKLSATFYQHPKALAAGRAGREVFTFALCINAGGDLGGAIPIGYFGPTYLAHQLGVTPEEADEGFKAAVQADLLAVEGKTVMIVGWDPAEWGNPKSTSRVQAHRERKRETANNETERNVSVSVGNAETQKRREEKKLEEKDPPNPLTGECFASGAGSKRKKAKPADPTPSERDAIANVLAKLSERSGREYRPSTDQHARRVLRLLRAGHTERELRMVVWDRANRWAEDEKMAEYLRPATVFGPEKFPDYLAEAKAAWKAGEEQPRAGPTGGVAEATRGFLRPEDAR